MGEAKRELLFLELQAIGCGGDAPWIVSVRGFTCRVKQGKEIDKQLDGGGRNGDIQN